jgi:small subunit ribosomal protein S16
MVRIKIYTSGRKNSKTYRIVAASEKSPRDGRYICQLGHYDPRIKKFHINEDLLKSFKANGAQLTQSAVLLIKENKMEHLL